MRSDLVFSAAVKTPNRYLLCRMLSVSARHMAKPNTSFANGINSVLTMASNAETSPVEPITEDTRPIVNNQLSRMVGMRGVS